jgi:hypothetical protein
MKNMTTYFDQIDRIKPRSGQSPDELLKVRLALIDKFISEFHKKFVETHHEDLGDMAKIEATHLSKEYLQHFTTFYTNATSPPQLTTQKMTTTRKIQETKMTEAHMGQETRIFTQGRDFKGYLSQRNRRPSSRYFPKPFSPRRRTASAIIYPPDKSSSVLIIPSFRHHVSPF